MALRWCRTVLVVVGLLVLLHTGVAQASTIFVDNFDTENGGTGAGNWWDYTAFTNWNITSWSVDIIGQGGPFDLWPGNGLYVDLAGSDQGAVMQTKRNFTLDPSRVYILTFSLAGNGVNDVLVERQYAQAAGQNSVTVDLGPYSETFTLDRMTPFTTFTRYVTVQTLTTAPLMFDATNETTNIALKLDNITLSDAPIPEPSTFALLFAAIPAFLVYRRMHGASGR